ncbi:MAG: LptA/OstA family protein [Stenotrophobium sp.]
MAPALLALCATFVAQGQPTTTAPDADKPAAGSTVTAPATAVPASAKSSEQFQEEQLEQQLDRRAATQAAAAPPTASTAVATNRSATTPAVPTVAKPGSNTAAAGGDNLKLTEHVAANPKTESRDALRPTGPVTVTADHAEWQNGGDMVYTGNVQLSSDTLQLRGARLELSQFPDGQYLAKLSGAPARMDHAGGVDDKGQPLPPVSAQGANLTYDTRSDIVDIVGKAVLTRGKDEIDGSSIHYNVAQRRIQASSDNGSQVKIVIQPPPAAVKATPAASPATSETPATKTAPTVVTAPATDVPAPSTTIQTSTPAPDTGKNPAKKP